MAARPPLAISPALRKALNSRVAGDFPNQETGGWQTFDVVSAQMAAGGKDAPTVSFPVTSALYEISGSAVCIEGTPAAATGATNAVGCLNGFTIQVIMSDRTQLNAGDSQLIGTSFFNRLNGIKDYRKPWVVGPNQTITFNLTNISGQLLTVYLGVTVLQLELSTNAVQF